MSDLLKLNFSVDNQPELETRYKILCTNNPNIKINVFLPKRETVIKVVLMQLWDAKLHQGRAYVESGSRWLTQPDSREITRFWVMASMLAANAFLARFDEAKEGVFRFSLIPKSVP